MASRVVRPETARLPLSDGDWLLVKNRLNAGENKRMVRRGSVLDETGRRFDGIEAGTAKILAYLIDWSIAGDDGLVIPIRGEPEAAVEAALDAVDPETYGEILHAIEAHVDAVATARSEEKKRPIGTPVSDPISPSLSAAGGASSGSAP